MNNQEIAIKVLQQYHSAHPEVDIENIIWWIEHEKFLTIDDRIENFKETAKIAWNVELTDKEVEELFEKYPDIDRSYYKQQQVLCKK